jgi:hypothetical protein
VKEDPLKFDLGKVISTGRGRDGHC